MTVPRYRPAAERLPWTPAATVAALACNGVALLLVLAGWYGGAGEAAAADVAHWADLSALGLVLALGGDAVLLAGARARIGQRQRRMADDRADRLAALPEALPAGPAALAPDAVVVGLPAQSLFHLPACRLVAGKHAVPLDAAARAGRSACGWCLP